MTDESGARELRIYYGSKEVSFDEERLFAFGEQLITQSEFVAERATAWGPGYAWPEIEPLLETLVDEGILHAGGVAAPAPTGLVASRVPASVCPVPRMWSAADCEAIMRDLGGRALEIGHLEVVIPPYRIAHPALDADDRQVGEGNVFPAGLRLDRETEWRSCTYTGSRYRDDAPMNVTALKAMIKHWKPMMAVVRELRAEVRRRLVPAPHGWTVGELHGFSRIVLAVPAYQLMTARSEPAPPLHPVWSSVFRITDGIRMTTHDMLFLSAERTRHPDEPITAAELYDFTERNGLFLSETGVCAGPRAMIDAFFAVVFDGVADEAGPVPLAPEVEALLARLPDAVDYALLGLQVWGVSRSVWIAMACAYRELRAAVAAVDAAADSVTADAGRACHRLRARIAADWPELERERLAVELEVEVHRTVYADAYAQAWRGLRTPVGPPTLAPCIAPLPETPAHRTAASQLRDVLAARLGGLALDGAPLAERIAVVLLHYLRQEQAILAAVAALQAEINRRLDRPQPTRPLTVRDFHLLFALSPAPVSGFPYLLDSIEASLGFRIECTADTIAVSDPTCCAGNPAVAQ